MKVLLDIKEAKVPFVMELLKNLSLVKAEALTPHRAKVLGDVKKGCRRNEISKVR